MQAFKFVDNLTGSEIKADDLVRVKGARSLVVHCGIQFSPCSSWALNGKALQDVPYLGALAPHAFEARLVALI
jgi:hypothetical protein